jgi:hypothetical protein
MALFPAGVVAGHSASAAADAAPWIRICRFHRCILGRVRRPMWRFRRRSMDVAQQHGGKDRNPYDWQGHGCAPVRRLRPGRPRNSRWSQRGMLAPCGQRRLVIAAGARTSWRQSRWQSTARVCCRSTYRRVRQRNANQPLPRACRTSGIGPARVGFGGPHSMGLARESVDDPRQLRLPVRHSVRC